MLDFLDTEKQVEGIPSGTPFDASGFIALWQAGILHRTSWTDVPEEQVSKDWYIQAQVSNSGKTRYWCNNEENAKKINEAVGVTFPPETVWHFECDTSKVANFFDAETASKFGDRISFDVVIKTPGSIKHRHEFHLIALPYSVQAYALTVGLLQEPVFNANELLFADNRYNDAFQADMIGNPDAKGAKTMLECNLGRRRVELWKALGETENLLAYRPFNKEKKEKIYTSSDNNLSKCLQIYSAQWNRPIWCEVGTFYDPRVDSEYANANGEMVRPRIPGLVRLFNSETEARAVAEERRREREAQSGAETTATPSTPSVQQGGAEPPVPSEWREFPDQWKDELKRVKGGLTNVPKAVAIQRAVEELSATKEEIAAWWDSV